MAQHGRYGGAPQAAPKPPPQKEAERPTQVPAIDTTVAPIADAAPEVSMEIGRPVPTPDVSRNLARAISAAARIRSRSQALHALDQRIGELLVVLPSALEESDGEFRVGLKALLDLLT